MNFIKDCLKTWAKATIGSLIVSAGLFIAFLVFLVVYGLFVK
jgi:hypothetical protein